MKIFNLYAEFLSDFEKKKNVLQCLQENPNLQHLAYIIEKDPPAEENIRRWLSAPEYSEKRKMAMDFAQKAPSLVQAIEKKFGQELKGDLLVSPSLLRFDGFARYDSGSHQVWFGIDLPESSMEYLMALLAHELSHVYRDHQPEVWEFLNKPLSEISRDEYLANITPEEHLVSEGLATLFSQSMFPEIELHLHHFYMKEEMSWCLENFDKVDQAIRKAIKSKDKIYSFYEPGLIDGQSPPRIQYFWAAKVIAEWIGKQAGDYHENLIKAHGLSCKDIPL